MQRLLNEYAWDAHAMRDVVQSYVVENLTEPDGVLVGRRCIGWRRGVVEPSRAGGQMARVSSVKAAVSRFRRSASTPSS